MKRVFMPLLSICVFVGLSALPSLAQHGHGGGMGSGGGMGGMGQGMGPGSMGPHGEPGMQPGSMGTHGQPGMEGSPMGRESQMGRMGNHSQTGMQSSTLNRKSTIDLLTQNKRLSSRLQSLLPEGTNVQDAAKGFKNLGQFVAAVHVSHNLGIPFDHLKQSVLANGDNLGKAIHELNPKMSKKDAKAAAKKARRQANVDFKAANS
jgi:hypothetical protein